LHDNGSPSASSSRLRILPRPFLCVLLLGVTPGHMSRYDEGSAYHRRLIESAFRVVNSLLILY
jgi:hypothetical protein